MQNFLHGVFKSFLRAPLFILEIMKEIIVYIVGDNTLGFFIAWCLFAFFGLFLSVMIAYSGRNNDTEFNLLYFWRDNKWDLTIWLIGTLAVERFYPDLMSIFFSRFEFQDMFIAFGWGFMNASIVRAFRKTDLGSVLKLPTKADGTLREEP